MMNVPRHTHSARFVRKGCGRSSFIIHHSAFAFTFFEILIVMLILGVLMGVTLPKLKGTLGQARLKTAARDVTALMRMGRDFAIFREQPVEVRFNPDKDTYQIMLLDKSLEPTKENTRQTRRSRRSRDKQELRLGDDAAGVRQLPNNVHFQTIYTAAPLTSDRDELPRVIFYSDGAASPATIVLQDNQKRAMSVEVFRTTGMTRVMAAEPAEEPKTQKRYYGPETGKKSEGRNNAEVAE